MATEAESWTVTTWNLHGIEEADLERVAAAIATEHPTWWFCKKSAEHRRPNSPGSSACVSPGR